MVGLDGYEMRGQNCRSGNISGEKDLGDVSSGRTGELLVKILSRCGKTTLNSPLYCTHTEHH